MGGEAIDLKNINNEMSGDGDGHRMTGVVLPSFSLLIEPAH